MSKDGTDDVLDPVYRHLGPLFPGGWAAGALAWKASEKIAELEARLDPVYRHLEPLFPGGWAAGALAWKASEKIAELEARLGTLDSATTPASADLAMCQVCPVGVERDRAYAQIADLEAEVRTWKVRAAEHKSACDAALVRLQDSDLIRALAELLVRTGR